MKFESLELDNDLLESLKKQGIIEATEIQESSIPILLGDPTDFIGQAQTGTGKTLAFLLPLVSSKINFQKENVQSLILAPTRELASQIAAEVEKIIPANSHRVETVYGGQSMGLQIRSLKRNKPAILVGTPGRVKDLLDRELLDLSQCNLCVLDEADEMLDMGFLDDVRIILNFLSEKKKTWMFSATMPPEIRRLVQDFFSNPKEVKIKKKTLSSENVEQVYYLTRFTDKFESLARILDGLDDFFLIIFCKTKIETKEISDELNRRGILADALHGDMVQDQRDLTMDRFKNKHVKILVCTDVAARGIDVDCISHVINYGLPQDNESYVHRIGRTGRAGHKGVALSLLDSAEVPRIQEIESITKAKIERKYLPEVEELKNMITRRAVNEIIKNNTEITSSDNFEDFSQSLSELSKEDILRAVFNRTILPRLQRYEGARKIDIEPFRPKPTKPGFQKYFINLGRSDGLELGDLLKVICRNANLRGNDIGKIVFKDQFSFFEVNSKVANRLSKLNNLDIQGKIIKCEESSADQRRRPSSRRKPDYRNQKRF